MIHTVTHIYKHIRVRLADDDAPVTEVFDVRLIPKKKSSSKKSDSGDSGGGGGGGGGVVEYDDDDELVLEHFASVEDLALFQNFAINAVVEGIDQSEIYMTEWLPYGLPSTG